MFRRRICFSFQVVRLHLVNELVATRLQAGSKLALSLRNRPLHRRSRLPVC